MKSLTDLLTGVAEAYLYSGMRNYIYARIEYFMEHMLSKNLTLALSVTVGLFTVWIMIQGYMIATGRSQEGLKGFVFNLGKNYLIILLALGVASSSSFALRTVTEDLTNGVSQVMTGSNSAAACLNSADNNSVLGCKIDKNLMVMQGTMAFISQIDTANDPIVSQQAERAKWFAGIGTAGPAIVAGTMLMMYRIAMALFIGFGPIFILALLFKRTAPLFQKWLFYGLATIFSSILLAVMADISADLVETIAKTLFVTNIIAETIGIDTPTAGVMQAATQQLGLGLILSTLLITVPPMAGMFFNGVMGNFTPFSGLGGWGGGAPQTLPPHLGGGNRSTVVQQTNYQNNADNRPPTPPQAPQSQNTPWSNNTVHVSSDRMTPGTHSPARDYIAAAPQKTDGIKTSKKEA